MAEHIRITRNRREFISNAFCGFGKIALFDLLLRESARAGTAGLNPLAPKPPQLADQAKAKSCIFLFMAGGPSHMDTFDPKPLLTKLNGQPRPAEFGEAKYQFVPKGAKLLGSARTFASHGRRR